MIFMEFDCVGQNGARIKIYGVALCFRNFGAHIYDES